MTPFAVLELLYAYGPEALAGTLSPLELVNAYGLWCSQCGQQGLERMDFTAWMQRLQLPQPARCFVVVGGGE